MSWPVRWMLGFLIVGSLTLAGLAWALWPVLDQLADPHRSRNYRVAAESMLPTLALGDRVRPRIIGPASLRRGMVVAFTANHITRIDRIAGLPSDRIALKGGRVWLNGKPVETAPVGPGPLIDGQESQVWRERFPGERGGHWVLDLGLSIGDDFAEVIIPPKMLFLLGDNRDRSADSRFPVGELGLAFVPMAAVQGEVDRVLWRGVGGGLGDAIDGKRP